MLHWVPMVIFREEQRFRRNWAYVTLIPPLIVAYGLYRQIAKSGPLGDNPAAAMVLWSALAATGAVALWFFQARLITEVRDNVLWIRLLLWPERSIPWTEIRWVEAFTFRPIKDYGGYGVRWNERGIVYTVCGNRGARMELMSGERVLVGSQRADELARLIAERIAQARPPK
jgi:hypothetical protein